MSRVLPLAQVNDARAVGGKAFNLARMARCGVAVPPAVVVCRSAFDAFLAENGLSERIAVERAGLEIGRPETISRAAARVRKLVVSAALPQGLRDELQSTAGELLARGPVIVRSSGVGEDSTSASFAGQLDSLSDIRSSEELERAIIACWASYWCERALFYQLSRGSTLDGMGVVIQQQIEARFSGVLFTEAPWHGRQVLLVEYCEGPGEALVSGRVTPERVMISRRNLSWERVADPETLPDAAIESLAPTGLALEKKFEAPQDIEWILDVQGKLHFVQSRPITTSRKAVWSNVNVDENFPEPISPLLYSIASLGYYHYFRNLARAFGLSSRRIRAMEQPLRGLVGVHCGRIYYNLTNLHAVLRMAPCGDALAGWFNQFVGTDLAPAPPRGARSWNTARRGSRFAELARVVVKVAWQYAFLSRRVTAFERRVDRFAERTHPDALTQRTLQELRDDLQAFMDIRCRHWVGASLADAGAMVCHGLLKRCLLKLFPQDSQAALHTTLIKGLPDLVSARPAEELWKLSRRIAGDPVLARLFAAHDGHSILAQLKVSRRHADFLRQLEGFLEDWGFRFSGELMLTVPSYQENPAALIDLLKSYTSVQGESPLEVMQRQAAERKDLTRGMVREIGRRPRTLYALGIRLLLTGTQRSIGLRERARMKQALLYSRCRRIALNIADRLVQQGRLAERDDVFFLTVPELDEWIAGRAMFPRDLDALVQTRKTAHETYASVRPPETLMLDEGEYVEPESVATAASNAGRTDRFADELSGISACGGVATGTAALVRDLSESHLLSPGGILVTRQTDPGWGPLFFLASGLVLERGGMLSHGAILAREYGLPCVIAAAGAMDRIPSGRTVSVNGDLGVVRICDR